VGICSGESGGVGCSTGLSDRDVSGSLLSCLSGIAMCCGDSCRFPVVGGGCDSFQVGPLSRVNSLCFSNNGAVRMGAGRGSRDEDAGGGGSCTSGESSFCFLVTGDGWKAFHSGGVGLSPGNTLKSGCLGNKGVVRLGVIDMIRGNSEESVMGGDSCIARGKHDEGATGGDGCGVILRNGGMSHGRGMRSSDDSMYFLTGGNGVLFVCWVTGDDVGKDGGRGMLIGSGVSSIGTGGSYHSIDEYSR